MAANITPYSEEELKTLYEQTGDPFYVTQALGLHQPPKWATIAWIDIGVAIAHGKDPLKRKKGRPPEKGISLEDFNRLFKLFSNSKAGVTLHSSMKSYEAKLRTQTYRYIKQYTSKLEIELARLANISPNALRPEDLKEGRRIPQTLDMAIASDLLGELFRAVKEIYKFESLPLSIGRFEDDLHHLPVLYKSLIIHKRPPFSRQEEDKDLQELGLKDWQIEKILNDQEEWQTNTMKAIEEIRIKRLSITKKSK